MQKLTAPWLVVLLGIPVLYAVTRYHVLQGVPWAQFPLFIANKALSLAAVFLIAASYLIGKAIRHRPESPGRRLILARTCGLIGFSMAAIHTLMALLIASPRYYPRFFQDGGKMNLTGELSLLLGVLALWCLSIPAITSLPVMLQSLGSDRWSRGQQMGYLALLLVAGHTFVMGFSGWIRPHTWPGGLPPISLVAFVAASIPLLVKLRRI